MRTVLVLPIFVCFLSGCDGANFSNYKVLSREVSGEFDYKIGDIVTAKSCASGRAKIDQLSNFDSSGVAHKMSASCE